MRSNLKILQKKPVPTFHSESRHKWTCHLKEFHTFYYCKWIKDFRNQQRSQSKSQQFISFAIGQPESCFLFFYPIYCVDYFSAFMLLFIVLFSLFPLDIWYFSFFFFNVFFGYFLKFVYYFIYLSMHSSILLQTSICISIFYSTSVKVLLHVKKISLFLNVRAAYS